MLARVQPATWAEHPAQRQISIWLWQKCVLPLFTSLQQSINATSSAYANYLGNRLYHPPQSAAKKSWLPLALNVFNQQVNNAQAVHTYMLRARTVGGAILYARALRIIFCGAERERAWNHRGLNNSTLVELANLLCFINKISREPPFYHRPVIFPCTAAGVYYMYMRKRERVNKIWR